MKEYRQGAAVCVSLAVVIGDAMCWGPLFCGGEADVPLLHVSISRAAKAMRDRFEQGLEQFEAVTLSVATLQRHPKLFICLPFQLVTAVSSAEAKMSGTCKCSTSGATARASYHGAIALL